METLSEIASLVEYSEARVYLDMFEAAPAPFAAEHGMRTAQFGSASVITMRSMNAILFNRVMCLGLGEPITDALLDKVVQHLKRTAAHNFAVQISPAVPYPELPILLQKRGLKRTNAWMKVFRGTSSPPRGETDYVIRQAGADEAETCARVFCSAFGLPSMVIPWLAELVGREGWVHYLAYDGEAPVGTGALYIHDDMGHLGLGGTLPSHRRQGIQQAIIAQRLRDGLDAGCHWFISETDEDTKERPNTSYRNLLTAGFRLAYPRPNYEFVVSYAG